MKKFLTMMLIITLALTAFISCASSNESTGSGDVEEAKLVYLITMDKMDQHWVNVDKGAKVMAEGLGLKYKWDAPDVKDNAKQIEAVNNAVADNADLILLAANDPQAISEAVKNAKAKGVKIIYVDSAANEPAIATLSTNNYQAGALAGQTMVDELTAAGQTSGKIGIIGVNTATNSTMDRENGFRSVLEAAGYEILTTEYKDGDAAASQESAYGFIVGNEDLVGLYGTNEGSTVGVGNAIKASGKDIIGIGFDKSDAIQGLLNDGSLKAAMAQNPFTMGYLGVGQAYAALNDESTGPAVIDTGVAVLRGE
ncbi:substrate-binding domain-containing protein [Acidaminobacter sp. JC074]|uniref:substrate-binding domain-containing protein n=1 Tax=Acidaminobacter sp. JC074 TaxID=2530199 RepID=UPI001F0DAE39|nr:substrate-binding domain-containing protein [Acidaminobacter sp. JC074]MCH4887955.1 substrate-binding domain-containing protein [Acidaminobacter sp. JC074]